jgi:hypothetical protein
MDDGMGCMIVLMILALGFIGALFASSQYDNGYAAGLAQGRCEGRGGTYSEHGITINGKRVHCVFVRERPTPGEIEP